jgi:hypothetical protein
MTRVLDRYFIYRLRIVTGQDGNPLSEAELLSESLIFAELKRKFL